MKFKDIKINQRFRFIGDPKIYLKEDAFMASRNMSESYIFQSTEVELVADDEKENHEEIDKGSVHSHLIRKYVNGTN